MTDLVLITGAGRRIGRATALYMASQGWDIIVHYNRSAADAAELGCAIEVMGRKAILAEVDLLRSDLVEKLIPALTAELGPIKALVNNASMFELDTRDPDGALHNAINFEAPRLLTEALFAQIPQGQKGAVVNLLDGMPPENGLDSYNRSKAKLKDYTLQATRQFAPKLRVNGIAPGPILPNVRQSQAHFEAQVASTLLKTKISPEDVARAVHFLLTAPSITGEILHVDGGRHALG